MFAGIGLVAGQVRFQVVPKSLSLTNSAFALRFGSVAVVNTAGSLGLLVQSQNGSAKSLLLVSLRMKR